MLEVNDFEYAFPAVKGIQAGRQYYITMCPLRLIPKIFLFDESEIPAELRAQRRLNHSRVPEIASYIVDNKTSYIFSALTASVDSEVKFQSSTAGSAGEGRAGTLYIPMTASFVINDGQHRRAAIQEALEQCPELGYETISIVLFIDIGLKRSQQMFADLNRYAVQPTPSISVLYDHRDPLAEITRGVIRESQFLSAVTEMEKGSLAARSRKLFTLAALHTANKTILSRYSVWEPNEAIPMLNAFWDMVLSSMPLWRSVVDGRISAGEVRKEYINSHAVVLHALGVVGKAMLDERARSLRGVDRLQALSKIDWRRSNSEVWEGKAMNDGAVSKSRKNVELTADYIASVLKVSLN